MTPSAIPAQDPPVTVDYGCAVPNMGTVDLSATVSGSAPASAATGSAVSVSNYQVSLTIPASLVNDILSMGGSGLSFVLLTEVDVNASNATPGTLNGATNPIPVFVSLVQNNPATIQAPPVSVGPFIPESSGTIDFRPGPVTIVLGAVGQIPCTVTTSPVPAFASTVTSGPPVTALSFTTTGEHAFTVPPTVTSVHVVAVGAGGGVVSPPGLPPGFFASAGATVTANLPVTPGATLYGEVGIGGGAGGGGLGQLLPGGSGGGESDVRTCSVTASNCGALGSAQDPRLLVAGGGGGGGGFFCQGLSCVVGGGSGGNGGAGGNSTCNPGAPGGPGNVLFGSGTPPLGGSGGTCSGGGGNPGAGGAGSGGSGGGGAGFFGGGAGDPADVVCSIRSCAIVATAGGGGGGSSFAEAGASNVSMVVNGTAPSMTISYTLPTDLSGANLSHAALTGVNLTGVNLTAVNLNRADLSGANLTGANLTGANLTGANLTGANLTGANLTGANLNGANLSDANLSTAVLTGANVNGVTWATTTCPDGTNSDADGGSCAGHL